MTRILPSRARTAAYRCLALGAGAMLAVLAHEALLRGSYLSPGQYVPDPLLGVDRVAHSQVLVRHEGGVRLGFDRHGLNNDDAAWDRPGRRIGVLGDSFTEAVEVPRAANYVTRLGDAWPEWVVLNLGRAAMTPPRMVELHRRLAEGERLDLLLLAVSDNDLDELAATPGPGCSPPETPVGALRRRTASLASASSLLGRTQLRLRNWATELKQAWRGPAPDAAAPAEAPAAGDAALAQRFVACIAALAARQPVAVAILPGGNLPRTDAQWQQGLQRQAVVREAARQAGAVAVVDAWTAFGRDPLGDGRLVNGFANHILGAGHPNELGHAQLGSLLAAALAPVLREPLPQRQDQIVDRRLSGP